MADRVIIPKTPHCFHQDTCPVVVEAVNNQDCQTLKALGGWLGSHGAYWGGDEMRVPYLEPHEYKELYDALLRGEMPR